MIKDAIANLVSDAVATVLSGVACDRNSKSIVNRILKFLLASDIARYASACTEDPTDGTIWYNVFGVSPKMETAF